MDVFGKGEVMALTTAIKSGRAFNDRESDGGTIVHLVEALPSTTSGYWGGKSLCGVTPGIRGNGWHEVAGVVTCERCIKKRLKSITI